MVAIPLQGICKLLCCLSWVLTTFIVVPDVCTLAFISFNVGVPSCRDLYLFLDLHITCGLSTVFLVLFTC